MAEEFQGGVCGGNWWNSSRNLFGSSPCSSELGNFNSWPSSHDQFFVVDSKTSIRSDDDSGSNSDVSGCSAIAQDIAKPIGMSFSSSTTTTHDWNRDFVNIDSAKSEENYSQIILQEAAAMNFCEDFSTNSLIKQMNNQDNLILQQDQPITNNSTQCLSIPLDSTSYGYTSSLLQTLFDTDDSQPQLLDNQTVDYSSAPSCTMINSNEFLPSLPQSIRPSLAKQQACNNFQYTNNTPFGWNSKAAALDHFQASFLPATQSQLILSSSSVGTASVNLPNLKKKQNDGVGNKANLVAKRGINEPALKRPRIETPSPLPTFKVRKEKLGDRVTALQQLVSPFGKTDTASVLHEAIEYIKFLHDQVSVLSTPYLKNGSPPLQHQQAIDHNKDDQEGQNRSLRSRGLCLVPISSTFPLATETTSDFWTPTFGGSFR